jgi:hypothetical protein
LSFFPVHVKIFPNSFPNAFKSGDHVKSLVHASFPGQAERISALYNEEEDALHLGMLGQEYVIRHDGIILHGQQAPEINASVIRDYLSSSGTTLSRTPWRAIGDLSHGASPDFRKRVELPISSCAVEIIARAKTLLPMLDAEVTPSFIGSDMAITVRALPKVNLHVELSQETQDFPAEAWVLFSNNADQFLLIPGLQALAEMFKDRLLSLIRIY